MNIANLRKFLYFQLVALRNQPLGYFYEQFQNECQNGIPTDTTKNLLINLIEHCKHSVPYYSRIITDLGDSYSIDPFSYLENFPILTKDSIRKNFDDLKSSDLHHRKWYLNTSGGSTGDPVTFIQDLEYAARMGAIKLLYSKLAGRELGESELIIWGSERDIIKGSEKWQTRILHRLMNSTFINAFRMTPENMKDVVTTINSKMPRLIVAYVDSIFELASFIEREGLMVKPQNAIMTSAGVLFPPMREKIEKVFQCTVYNRYGSREVGDIACERPGMNGLWVAPWGNYLEIIDRKENRVPDGVEGDILVTSLTNYAMPLIRYYIGDQGVLASASSHNGSNTKQVLEEVIGRTTDNIYTCNGTVVHGGYFMVLLFFKKWILKYQVVQKSINHLVFRIVRSDNGYDVNEQNEIIDRAKLVMGDDCKVEFEYVQNIPPTISGKHRYVISEIPK
jgi:phenylacetate-CoA ligase